MNKRNYLDILKEKYLYVALGTVSVMALAFIFTIIQPLNYSSTTEALVIQKQLTETDSYLSAKSAEKIASSLSSVVYSTSFFDKVSQSGLVDLSEISALSEADKRDKWEQKIGAQVVPETGIIQITAYDANPQEAENLASAVAYTLATQGDEYHGGGENIQVKVINSALTSKYPVKPNLFVNLALGLVIGLSGSLLYLYFLPEFNLSVKLKKVEKKIEQEVEEIEQVVATVGTEQCSVQPVQVEPQSINYSVLDHETYPEVEQINYSTAPQVYTMFDHLK